LLSEGFFEAGPWRLTFWATATLQLKMIRRLIYAWNNRRLQPGYKQWASV
jgi:hypothetical protein